MTAREYAAAASDGAAALWPVFAVIGVLVVVAMLLAAGERLDARYEALVDDAEAYARDTKGGAR